MEWIDEFYSYGVLEKITKEQEELLEKNAPSELFQYRSGNEYDLENIKNGVIWLSAVKKFNDPFDCDFCIQEYEEYVKEASGFSNIKFEDAAKKIKEDILEFRNSVAISCLSRISDSILMWSHYANHHQGFCLCYDINDLISLGKILLPVWYRGEKVRPFIKNGKILALNNRIKEIYVQKSEIWDYEEEWRLIEPIAENNFERLSFLRANDGVKVKGIYPKKIILGAKIIPEKLEKDVLEIANKKGIPVSKMYMCENTYTLFEKPI